MMTDYFALVWFGLWCLTWWSVLLVEETGVPGENHRPVAKSLANYITYCCTPRPDRDSNSQHQW